MLSPGGNWGSYPPHKHDELRDDETELEEIYHYIVADSPAGPGLAYQHVYGTPDRPIDLLTAVRTGDVISVNVEKRSIQLEVREAEIARRLAEWQPPKRDYPRGYNRLFADHIRQADKGCDFDFLEGAAPTPEPEIH